MSDGKKVVGIVSWVPENDKRSCPQCVFGGCQEPCNSPYDCNDGFYEIEDSTTAPNPLADKLAEALEEIFEMTESDNCKLIAAKALSEYEASKENS